MKSIEFRYKETALLPKEQIAETARSLESYIAYCNEVVHSNAYKVPESFINVPSDGALFRAVQKAVEQKRTQSLKYIVVVGIGGSNLGTVALYEALYGKLDAFASNRFPKILFLDTTSASLVRAIEGIIENEVENPDEILVNVISKSGTNTEPLANFETLYQFLCARFGNINKRIVVTTAKKAKLSKLALAKKFTVLTIPEEIGGRYSVFTAVGLFPLLLCGIDGKELVRGAVDMRERCLALAGLDNPAILSATLLFLHYKKGIIIHNNFFFNPELESVGKWYRQLMAESIGKEKDLAGRTVHKGITPIVSIGSADLHSVAQLYLAGPADKFTYFMYAPSRSKIAVPPKLLFEGLVEGIRGKRHDTIMRAIFDGTKKAYHKRKLPFAEILLPDISPYSLGQYLQLRMMEMMFLGKLLKVNAFDQPNVEEYKAETRKLLTD